MMMDQSIKAALKKVPLSVEAPYLLKKMVLITKDKLKWIRLKVKALFPVKNFSTEESGIMIFLMDKDNKYTAEYHIIWVILKKVKKMDLEDINGI